MDIPVTTPPAIVGAAELCLEDPQMKLTDDIKREYEFRFTSCIVKKESVTTVAVVIARIMRGQERYKAAADPLGVPWFVVALVHQLECNGDFTCHLHNGDPLDRRTVQVPKNRPIFGKPPFTWEQSATDALTYQRMHEWSDWSVGGVLFKLEEYNGFGYRRRAIASPYLWSGSQFYSTGKFVKDGVFDRTAVSKQIGAAVVLRRLADLRLATFGELADDCEGLK